MSSLWVEATDSTTNRVYYYNKDTKQTQWTRPADMEEAKTDAADECSSNWAESTDSKSGRRYYYNRVTKKTTWQQPKCLQLASPAHSRNASVINVVHSPGVPTLASFATIHATAVSPPHSTHGSPRGGPPPLPASTTATASQPLPPQTPSSPPPSVWAEAKDPSTGRSYWYNRDTKETSWVNPTPSAAQMTVNPLSSAAPAPASVAGTMTSAAQQSYRYATHATLTAETLQTMQGMRGGPQADEAKQQQQQTPPLPSLPQGGGGVERRDLHSLLDLDDDGHSSDDAQDSAATSPTGSRYNTLSPSDAATLTTQHVRERLEADGSADSTPLHFSKHRKGWFKRTFHVGTAFSSERLMEFKKSMIKKSLLKENRHLDTLAVQLFKNVMSYMGDRKSSKGCKDHCQKLLRLCLSAPTGIRDEVYVQLMKQTTKNPKKESERRGWELLTQCLSFFPPSKMIVDTVRDYIEKAIVKEAGAVAIAPPTLASVKRLTRDQHTVLTLATLALSYLPLVQQQGPRLNVPCEFELHALVDFTPIYLTVYTVHDGHSHSLPVDAFTRVKDVVQAMSQRFGLGSGHELTALYEGQGNDPAIFSQHPPPPTAQPPTPPAELPPCDTRFFTARKLNEERLCDDELRVLDVVSAWENPPLVEEMSGEEVGDEGYNSAFVKREDKVYKKKGKEVTKMGLDEMLQEKLALEKGGHNVLKLNRLVWKVRLVVRITEPALSHDKEAVRFLFYQLHRDCVIERYPVVDKDVTTLAALFLQVQHGNCNADRWTAKRLQELATTFIPWSYIPSTTQAGGGGGGQAESFYASILSKWSKLASFSAYEAMLSYIDYAQASVYYGEQSFLVEQRQFAEHPNILQLAVTCEGVLFLHPGMHLEKELLEAEGGGGGKGGGKEVVRDVDKERERRERDKKESRMKQLEHFPYTDLVTWGNSDEKFILVIGNLIQQRKLILKTKEGKTINALIHEYVKRKVQQRERANSK